MRLKDEAEKAENYPVPVINEKSRRIMERSKSKKLQNRNPDFLEREREFLQSRDAERQGKANEKLLLEDTMLTFQPNLVANSARTPNRMNKMQANNFWERNQAFVNYKKDKLKKMDMRYNKDLTFQPEILPKSRNMSLNSTKTSTEFSALGFWSIGLLPYDWD